MSPGSLLSLRTRWKRLLEAGIPMLVVTGVQAGELDPPGLAPSPAPVLTRHRPGPGEPAAEQGMGGPDAALQHHGFACYHAALEPRIGA